MANFHESEAYILLLDLKEDHKEEISDSDENQDPFVVDLGASISFVSYAHIIRSTAETANQLLSIPNLKTVIVLDTTISSAKHKILAKKLVEYAKGGGNIVFGGLLWNPDRDINDSINKIFADLFDVSWRIGRNKILMDLQINPAISTILTARQFRWLNWRYMLKGNYIINVKDDHQVFHLRPLDDDFSVPTEKNRCALACQKFGKGRLNFIGFSEDEEPTKLVYQAICDIA